MEKYISLLLAAVLALLCLSACHSSDKPTANDSKKLSIVPTIFFQYDFIRQIVGDKAGVTMLLKPGAESHSYEPTPKTSRPFKTATCSSIPEAKMMYGWTIF